MRPPILLLLVTGMALAQSLPKGEGAETYERVCGGCHAADIVTGMQRSRNDWAETVRQMKDRGAIGSDADFRVVTDYLARNFALKSTFAEPEFDHTPAKKRSRWDRFLSVVLPWRWF